MLYYEELKKKLFLITKNSIISPFYIIKIDIIKLKKSKKNLISSIIINISSIIHISPSSQSSIFFLIFIFSNISNR